MTSDELAKLLLRDAAWKDRCICAAVADFRPSPLRLDRRMWECVKPRLDCPLAGKPECIGVRAFILTITTTLEREGWVQGQRSDARTKRSNFFSFYGDQPRNDGYVLCPYFKQRKLSVIERRERAEQMKRQLARVGLKSRIDVVSYVFVPFDQTSEPAPDCEGPPRQPEDGSS